MGAAPGGDKEGRVLNRMVRCTEDGVRYEADPRQHEKLVGKFDLEGAKSVVTPIL